MDRYKPPEDPDIECYCTACGGEIYKGDGYWDYEGDPIHDNDYCQIQYFHKRLNPIERRENYL